ncbi:MAG: response regulator [Flavobacteriales bacterium]|nr:response regulator [Flavobacteriales bacterium]
MAEEIIRVLYLDDEEANLFSFKAAFRREFEVHTCIEPHQAVRLLDEHDFHVVLSDQRMPRISGVEFFELIMPDHPDVSRVLVTGYADTDAVVDAINKGQVYRFVSKPWNEEELRNVIQSGYDLNQSRVQNAEQGSEVLAMLEKFAGRVQEFEQALEEGSSASVSRVQQDLRNLRLEVLEERQRYAQWMDRTAK